MAKIAVIEIKGHQYLAEEGKDLVVDLLAQKVNSEVVFDKLLLYLDEQKKVTVGKPYISKGKLTALVVKHDKGQKIRVARFRAKSRYRKVKGFRPQFTLLKIKKITV